MNINMSDSRRKTNRFWFSSIVNYTRDASLYALKTLFIKLLTTTKNYDNLSANCIVCHVCKVTVMNIVTELPSDYCHISHICYRCDVEYSQKASYFKFNNSYYTQTEQSICILRPYSGTEIQ